MEVTDEIVKLIKDSINEQSQSSNQIRQALQRMNESTLDVRNASAGMAQGNGVILEEVNKLQLATNKISESMSEMSNNAETISRTDKELHTFSSDIEKSLIKISNQIDTFKV